MNTQVAQAIDQPPQAEMAYVIDPTVQPDGPKRTHEILRADKSMAQYTFGFQEPLGVPLPHALKFLENGFRVFADPECTRALKRSRSAKDGHDGQVLQALADHEVIAGVDELTQAALYKRAAALPGGDAFKPNAKKDDLVAFVTAFNRENSERRKRVEVDDMPDGGGLSPAEVDKINAEFVD